MRNLFFIVFLFLLSNSIMSQSIESDDKYPQTVVIKMIEIGSGAPANAESQLIVVNPENQIEKKALNDFNYSNSNNKAIESNALQLKIEIQKWHNLGYTVRSSNTSAPTFYCIISTYVLQKN